MRTKGAHVLLADEVARQYRKPHEWQIAAIRDGLRDAEQGRFVRHERLKAKWKKRLAAALDRTR